MALILFTSPSSSASVLCIFLVSFFFSSSYAAVVVSNTSVLYKLMLPGTTVGPESLAFDSYGGGPYTGVADGRILKYEGLVRGFVDFAFTSPNWTKEVCAGKNDQSLGHICGRPCGIEFDRATGALYITDSSLGLLSVKPNGGLATQLAAGVNGVPFDYADTLAIDPVTRVVYFTDIGAVFRNKNLTEVVLTRDKSARLFQYDPKTRKVTTLLTGLYGANGMAMSKDGSFVLISEYIASRIRRYWLKGPKANSSDIFIKLKGNPDNIKRTFEGDFWVAMSIDPILKPGVTPLAFGLKISPSGKVLARQDLPPEYEYTSEVRPYAGAFFVGSYGINFVGVLWPTTKIR